MALNLQINLGNFFLYKFSQFWLPWFFVVVHGLSLVAVSVGYSSLCSAGFSLWWFSCGAWVLGTWASVVVAHVLSSCGSRALKRRLSSCGARAQLLRSMWDLPRPGLKPVSPALAGRFSTTALGSPWEMFENNIESPNPQIQNRSSL